MTNRNDDRDVTPWRSWPAHNLIAHPLSEILHWLGLGRLGNRLHDATLPVHEIGEGRG